MDDVVTLFAFWVSGILYGWCAHALYKSTKELADGKKENKGYENGYEQNKRVGHWIKIGNTLECPFCGAFGEDIKDNYCFNYCPNCGAKMEKVSK